MYTFKGKKIKKTSERTMLLRFVNCLFDFGRISSFFIFDLCNRHTFIYIYNGLLLLIEYNKYYGIIYLRFVCLLDFFMQF